MCCVRVHFKNGMAARRPARLALKYGSAMRWVSPIVARSVLSMMRVVRPIFAICVLRTHMPISAILMKNRHGSYVHVRRQVAFDVNMEHPFNDLIADTCTGRVGYSFLPNLVSHTSLALAWWTGE